MKRRRSTQLTYSIQTMCFNTQRVSLLASRGYQAGLDLSGRLGVSTHPRTDGRPYHRRSEKL